MIPSYKEDVKITIQERDQSSNVEQQLQLMQEEIRILRETVNYIDRERMRLKSDIESIKILINKR
jgi:hypothetical protein